MGCGIPRKRSHPPPLALCTEVPASGCCLLPYSSASSFSALRVATVIAAVAAAVAVAAVAAAVAAAAALAPLRKCESGDVSGEPGRKVQSSGGQWAGAVRVGALC